MNNFIAGYGISFFETDEDELDEHLMGSHDQKTHGNKFGTNDKGEKVLVYKGGSGGWKAAAKKQLSDTLQAKATLDKTAADHKAAMQNLLGTLQSKTAQDEATQAQKDAMANLLGTMQAKNAKDQAEQDKAAADHEAAMKQLQQSLDDKAAADKAAADKKAADDKASTDWVKAAFAANDIKKAAAAKKAADKAAANLIKNDPLTKAFTKDALAGMTDQQRAAYLAKNGNSAWIKSLTPQQKMAIETYTGGNYETINKTMRSGGNLGWLQKTVDSANSALLASKAPADMIVTRGIGSTPFFQTLVGKIGGTFTDQGFTSTTIGNELPSSFQSNLQVHIKVFKGAPGAYIDPISGVPGEKEWLPPSGSQFNVTHTYNTSDGISHVVMEYRGQPHIGGTTTASWHPTTTTEATSTDPKDQMDSTQSSAPLVLSSKFIWDEGDVVWLPAKDKGNNNGK